MHLTRMNEQHSRTHNKVPTIYKQDVFCKAGPHMIAGLTAVCAIVCFV